MPIRPHAAVGRPAYGGCEGVSRIQTTEHRIATLPDRSERPAPPADGLHDVRIYMVGAQQAPPMIAVDDEAIFVEDDAVGAAIEDGMAPDAARARYANEYSYYFRNSDPGWRILPVAADAVVTLETWRPLDGNTATAPISLQRFGRIYNGTRAEAHHFRWQHYEIVVEGGEVVRIQELNLMA
jgi:hypothetical protein